MNRIVNRDSDTMRAFARASTSITREFEAVSDHLSSLLYDAEENMQDQSGRDAITIIRDIIAELDGEIKKIAYVSQQITKSAEVLDETNELL